MELLDVRLVHLAGVATFLIAWVVGVGAWFFDFAEKSSMRHLTDRYFDLGPVASRLVVEIEAPEEQYRQQIGDLHRFRIRFTSSTRAIYVATAGTWVVKGVVEWHGSQAEFLVRHPLAPALFRRVWLVGWLGASCVVVAYTVQDFNRWGSGWPVALVFTGGVGGFLLNRFLVSREREMARTLIDELTKYFQRRYAA